MNRRGDKQQTYVWTYLSSIQRKSLETIRTPLVAFRDGLTPKLVFKKTLKQVQSKEEIQALATPPATSMNRWPWLAE